MRPRRRRRSRSPRRLRTSNPAGEPLEPIFDDKSGKRRVTGPVEFAIDGNDDTAWGIDAGPGTAQPAAQGRVRRREARLVPGGSDSHCLPEAEARRLELAMTTRTTISADSGFRSLRMPEPVPIRCRRDVRDILADPARAAHAAQQMRRSSATGAPPSRNGRRRTTRSRSCGESIPEGSSQLVLQTREQMRRDDAHADARRFPQARRRSSRRACRRSCIRCPRTRRRTG